MPEYFIGYEDDEMGRIFGEISSVLSLFLSEGHNIKKIEDEKVQEIIKQEKIIFEKTSILHEQLYFEGRYKLSQVKELQSAIYRDSPELKSTLAKLNNHQLNKGLIVFVACIWLAFFACVFGFLRALNTKHID